MDSLTKTLRGLSIAAIVLGALGAVAWLFVLVVVVICGIFAADPYLVSELSYGMGDGYSYSYSYGNTADMQVAAGVTIAILVVCVVFALAVRAVAIVAGVLGYRRANKPETLGSVFVWCIVAAVGALITCAIPTAIVLAIAAIWVYRIRNYREPAVAQPYAAPAMPAGYAPVAASTGYAAPVPPPSGYAPASGYAAPVASAPGYAPAQPPVQASAPSSEFGSSTSVAGGYWQTPPIQTAPYDPSGSAPVQPAPYASESQPPVQQVGESAVQEEPSSESAPEGPEPQEKA